MIPPMATRGQAPSADGPAQPPMTPRLTGSRMTMSRSMSRGCAWRRSFASERPRGRQPRSSRYPRVPSNGNRYRRRRGWQPGLDRRPLARRRRDHQASSEEVGALPHAHQAKLHTPTAGPRSCIETDAVVGHTNPQGVLLIVEADSSCMRGSVTGDVVDRLLDDSEGTQFDVGFEPYRGARHLEIHANSVGVLDVRKQAADGGDQAKLVQPGRSKPPSHLTQTSNDLEQLDTGLQQRCRSGPRPSLHDQPVHAAGEVNQPLKWVIVDRVGDVPALLFLRRQQSGGVEAHRSTFTVLLRQILKYQLSKVAAVCAVRTHSCNAHAIGAHDTVARVNGLDGSLGLAAHTVVGDAEGPVRRSAGDAISERGDGRRIRLGDHAICVDNHDGKEVGLKQLLIPELDLAPLSLSSLDAASLDHRALDVHTNEDRDPVDDGEVDQVVCGVAQRIGT